MTWQEIQDEIASSLREPRSGQMSGIYFSEQDIQEAGNDGYMELSDECEWFEEQVGIALLKDRPYYDLFAIIGPVFLSIKPAFDELVTRWLLPSRVRGLDEADRRWEQTVGRPQRLFLRGLRWMGLWPRYETDDATTRIKTYYTRLPVPLCAPTDEPGFPEPFHMGIVYFALADLFAEDGETTLALENWTLYLEVEQGLRQWIQHRVTRPMHRVMGAGTLPR